MLDMSSSPGGWIQDSNCAYHANEGCEFGGQLRIGHGHSFFLTIKVSVRVLEQAFEGAGAPGVACWRVR